MDIDLEDVELLMYTITLEQIQKSNGSIEEIKDALISLPDSHLEWFVNKAGDELGFTDSDKKALKNLFDQFKMTKKHDVATSILDKIKMTLILSCRKVSDEFSINYEKSLAEFDNRTFGKKDIFYEIISRIALQSFSNNTSSTPTAFLFVGSPSTGKTHIAECLAASLGLELLYFNVAGSERTLDLFGSGDRFTHAREGEILAKLINTDAKHFTILFDEIDKISRGGSEEDYSNPIDKFLEVLDYGVLRDEYLSEYDVKIDAPYLIFTANSIENLPKHFLSRVHIINFEEYDIDEKAQILCNYTIPELKRFYSKNGFSDHIDFDQSAIDRILTDYPDYTLREIKRNVLESIFAHIASEIIYLKNTVMDQKYNITYENLQQYL